MNNENLKKGIATRFTCGEVAVNNQKKSVEKRKQNKIERECIKQRLLERMGASDWDEMIDGVIERAKRSDKGFEVFRDTIGERPTDRTELEMDTGVRFYFDSPDGEDYSG